MQPKIWITGAGGLIGSYLLRTAPRLPDGPAAVGLTRTLLDIANAAAVRQAFRRDQPQLVIHCAALSQSPDCQANPALARKLNVDVTVLLAELATDIPFIFFSTDLVFDGRQGNYEETASVNPLSIYAETKVLAEQKVLANPRHTVVRTSLNGGRSPTGDRGFNEKMQRVWAAGGTLDLFTDEFRCPIHAQTTAQAIWELVSANRPGLYHLAGSQRLSRWEIGQLLAARCPHLNPKLVPGSLMQYKGAPRPPDTSFNCAKIQKLLSFPLPGLKESLMQQPEDW